MPVCSNSARLNAMSPDCDIRTSPHTTDIIFIGLFTLNCYIKFRFIECTN